MGGHMSCIGIPSEDMDVFGRAVSKLCKGTPETPLPQGGSVTAWRDPSGASLWVYGGAGGAVECVVPSFSAGTRVRLVPRAMAEDGSCRFCDRLLVDLVDAEGNLFYPMAIQLEDIGLAREKLEFGRAVMGRISGFAEELSVWPDEKAFIAGSAGLPMAPESLVPVGLFAGSEGPTTSAEARVLMTGRIVQAETLVNKGTGRPFVQARIKTYGAEFDVVAEQDKASRAMLAGGIVQGVFWMVGSI